MGNDLKKNEKTTVQKKQNANDYELAKPKQFGNLHQRMKFLVDKVNNAGEAGLPLELRWAVFDLEMEVKHYQPKEPPFGSREGYVSPTASKS